MKQILTIVKRVVNKINHTLTSARLFRDPILEMKQYTEKSSISDASKYIEICKMSALDEKLFSNFRRYESYFYILEHVSKKIGKEYADIILKRDPSLRKYKKIKKQNSIGNPIKYHFNKFGFTSPTLLRYLKVLTDIELLFGNLNGSKILEIGIGYGGQAASIIQSVDINSYYLFDLPEVNSLAKKFLFELNTPKKYTFFDGRNPINVDCDLIISNYAFSELSRQVQLDYLHNIIKYAPAGYITWNDLGFKDLNSLSIFEILESIPNSYLIEEQPLTAPNNKIIVWGSNKAVK